MIPFKEPPQSSWWTRIPAGIYLNDVNQRSPAEKSYPFCPKAGLCQSEAGLVYMVAYYVQWLLVGSGHGCEKWFPRLSIPLNSWGGFGVIEAIFLQSIWPPSALPSPSALSQKKGSGQECSGPQKGLKLGVSL